MLDGSGAGVNANCTIGPAKLDCVRSSLCWRNVQCFVHDASFLSPYSPNRVIGFLMRIVIACL